MQVSLASHRRMSSITSGPHSRCSSALGKKVLNAKISAAASSLSLSSVLFTSRPITTAICKREFQVWLLFLSLYWIAGVRTCMTTLEGGVKSHRLWNFTALDIDYPESSTAYGSRSVGISKIDLLTDEESLIENVIAQESGASVVLEVLPDSEPRVGGWCLTVPADNDSPRAMKFMLWASQNGDQWEQVGSSSTFLDSFGNVRHMNRRLHFPAESGSRMCFSFARDFAMVRVLLVSAAVVATLFIAAVLFAVAEYQNTCRVMVGGAQTLSALTMTFVSTIGTIQVGAAEASDIIVAAGCVYCFAYCFLVNEAAVLRCTIIVSALGLACSLVHLMHFHNVALFVCSTTLNIITFALFSAVSKWRCQQLQQAAQLVRADKEAYDAQWSNLALSSAPELHALQLLVDNTWQSGVQVVRQRQLRRGVPHSDSARRPWGKHVNHSRPASSPSAASEEALLEELRLPFSTSLTVGRDRAVLEASVLPAAQWLRPLGSVALEPGGGVATTLQELFEVAEATEPVLKSKVQDWAAAHGGLFKRVHSPDVDRHGAHLVAWERVRRGEDDAACVHWPPLKSPQRAVEKLYRAYGGDVALLADVCRQCIVFADIADLTACLASILADCEVAVERIKNRYDPQYDPAVSAGYRDVALNLRVVGGSAMRDLVAPELRESVAEHVCEVQLIVADFAVIKNDQGHARYVRYRDLRGQ